MASWTSGRGGEGALVRIVRALQILANWGGFCGLNIDVLRDLTLSVGDGRARPTVDAEYYNRHNRATRTPIHSNNSTEGVLTILIRILSSTKQTSRRRCVLEMTRVVERMFVSRKG